MLPRRRFRRMPLDSHWEAIRAPVWPLVKRNVAESVTKMSSDIVVTVRAHIAQVRESSERLGTGVMDTSKDFKHFESLQAWWCDRFVGLQRAVECSVWYACFHGKSKV